jgi:hypothetical protein
MILLSILIALVILYLFYLYLVWCSSLLERQTLYKTAYSSYYEGKLPLENIKIVATREDILFVKKWEFLIPSEVILDTVKPVRFWVLYYRAKFKI